MEAQVSRKYPASRRSTPKRLWGRRTGRNGAVQLSKCDQSGQIWSNRQQLMPLDKGLIDVFWDN
ncbi:unnamed protein product [Tenebrio molitor]|nr:unnamed protein product [Tenebrio molitor]